MPQFNKMTRNKSQPCTILSREKKEDDGREGENDENHMQPSSALRPDWTDELVMT